MALLLRIEGEEPHHRRPRRRPDPRGAATTMPSVGEDHRRRELAGADCCGAAVCPREGAERPAAARRRRSSPTGAREGGRAIGSPSSGPSGSSFAEVSFLTMWAGLPLTLEKRTSSSRRPEAAQKDLATFQLVEYLPVIFPPASKLENASLFAEKTSNAIASALNVVQTSHSFGDVMLLTKALQHGKKNPSAYLAEMAWVGRTFNVGTLGAVEFLDNFLSMNPDSKGRIKVDDFSTCLAFESNPLFEKIFHFLDVEKQGSITFRQFLVGSAHIMAQPSFQRFCEAKFNALSHNGSGWISSPKFVDFFRSFMPSASDEKVSEILRLLDIDKDGVVNKTDFMTFMRRNPLLVAIFASP